MRDLSREEIELSPPYIAILAEAVAVVLFIGMVAVWAALGAGA